MGKYTLDIMEDRHCHNTQCATCNGQKMHVIKILDEDKHIVLNSLDYLSIKNQTQLTEMLKQFSIQLGVDTFTLL